MKKCTFKKTGTCPKTCAVYELFDQRYAPDNACLVHLLRSSVEEIHDSTGKLLALFDEALKSQK